MTRKKHERDGLDLAGVGPDPKETRHLAPLHELDRFRIADGEPDIRGWHVFTSSGRDVGEVNDLLVDTSRGEVVMLDIDLEGTDRHSLAPIRAAWVDRDAKRVVLDGARFDADTELPSLRRGVVDDDEARQFARRYSDVYGDRGGNVVLEPHDVADADRRERERERQIDREERDIDRQREREAERERAEAAASERREVRYPARDEPGSESGRVVEEVVVRRRVLDRDAPDDARDREAPGAP